ncbi:MAG: hypothetical protein UU16_C0055G0008 [Candidatus Woesebacteria bacterium GW2011_GWA2_40_7]|uniref:Uncharacterized protein n=1 Tax=Candidatus Woesebacteria bacterium GW2011_GWA2_40_7 TaxID=1618562 RepID=A0A0G0W919_9BACT|nr:MAG: hypothetical protein UU16_C0055G0008 [Candidatus Woesebacteria bacterium GW2011_GWA2_40_7]
MDTRKHKTNLTNILIDIYKDATLASHLGFKGGTCTMLFYKLPLFWLISYEKGEHNIKVEVSTRDNPYNHYNNHPFYGVTIKTLAIEDIIAHKMVAFTERPSLANRDLFDIHFLLGTEFAASINYDVIKSRTGKNPVEFYNFLLNLIKKIDAKNILEGLGEVLTDSQKDWAKVKLLVELKGLIQRQIDTVAT